MLIPPQIPSKISPKKFKNSKDFTKNVFDNSFCYFSQKIHRKCVRRFFKRTFREVFLFGSSCEDCSIKNTFQDDLSSVCPKICSRNYCTGFSMHLTRNFSEDFIMNSCNDSSRCSSRTSLKNIQTLL